MRKLAQNTVVLKRTNSSIPKEGTWKLKNSRLGLLENVGFFYPETRTVEWHKVDGFKRGVRADGKPGWDFILGSTFNHDLDLDTLDKIAGKNYAYSYHTI